MSYIQNLTKLTHRLYVSPTAEGADFATLKEAVDWFNINADTSTEILLDGGNHVIDATIEINKGSISLNIKGLGSDTTTLTCTSDLELLMAFDIYSECTFSRLKIIGPKQYGDGSTCFDLNTSDYCEFYDLQVNEFTKAWLQNDKCDVFVFNFIVDGCAKFYECNDNTDGGIIDLEVGTITNTPLGIDFVATVNKDFIVNGLYFYGATASDTFINIEPEFGLNGLANVQNCGGNSVGNFQTGFTFSAATGVHADVEMIGNTTYESKNPHFKVNVIDNSATTTIITGNTFYKANFTNGSVYTCKMLLENNKYTYLSNHKKDMTITITGNMSVNQTNRNLNIGLKLNGTGAIISPFTVRTSTSGQPVTFVFTAYLSDLVNPSFFEIFVTSPTSGDIITIQDLNIFGIAL